MPVLFAPFQKFSAFGNPENQKTDMFTGFMHGTFLKEL